MIEIKGYPKAELYRGYTIPVLNVETESEQDRFCWVTYKVKPNICNDYKETDKKMIAKSQLKRF